MKREEDVDADLEGLDAKSAAAVSGEGKRQDRVLDPEHVRVQRMMKKKANELMDDAEEDPNSDANELVRIMLLNQMAITEQEAYQRETRLVVTEERRRTLDVKRHENMDRHRSAQLEMSKRESESKMEKERASIDHIKAQTKELELKIGERERQLAEALRTAQNAQAAIRIGQPMDPQQVYRRIAEIVGLRPPPGQPPETLG